MNRMVAVLAACIAMVPGAGVAARLDDDSFDFATLHTSSWVLTATTHIDWPEGGGLPTAPRVECHGENEQFDFGVTGDGDLGWLRIRFLGDPDRDGERGESALLGDGLWLYVDGERWEYANIPARSTAFANIHYPPPASGVIMPVWRGHQGVRKSDDAPWLNLRLIYDRLIGARRLEWSFRSRDWSVVDKRIPDNALPANWQTHRYGIDTDGLRDAVMWCAREIASEDAYVLPPAMRDRLGGAGQR